MYFNEFPYSDWVSYDSIGDHNGYRGKRASVAKAKKSDVLCNAARIYKERTLNPSSNSTRVVQFRKYVNADMNGNYSVDPILPGNKHMWDPAGALTYTHNGQLGHAGADIIDRTTMPAGIHWTNLHADAAYCRPLKKFLITVSNGPHTDVNGTLTLYSSEDGINWKDPLPVEPLVDNSPGRPPYWVDNIDSSHYYIEKPHSFFATLDPDASNDCHEVGGDFYIFTPYTYFHHVQSMSLKDTICVVDSINHNPSIISIFARQELYRHHVTITGTIRECQINYSNIGSCK